ncbi:MAG: N-acetylglucosamine-6-phosphate deacetylase [Acidimicrobiia bacterium]
MRLGVKQALVRGRIVDGDVTVQDGRVASVGVAPAGSTGLAAPGFVDVQINGFDGVDFTTADPAEYEHVAEKLAATGVTAFQPTLISLPPTDYFTTLRQARTMVIASARIIGIHLEGPFLAPIRCGAHDPENMVEPDPILASQFLEAGPFTYATIAPELPGALDLIEFLAAAGVVVALGHTDADATTAHAAFDRGAQSVTHIFGAQRPWKHRDPGISGVALVRDDVFITAIVDGIHLAPEATMLAANAAGDRFVLITDAIAAAGRPDGAYVLGDRTVILKDGACRLENGTLAGSSLTMDQAVRNMMALGYEPSRAIAAATSAPATLMRRDDLGRLEPGAPADVCILDDSFQVTRTLVGGVESFVG